jgi:hypothetical protein
MSTKRLVPVRNYASALVPQTANDGDMYLDTTNGRIQIFYNGVWKAVAFLDDIGTTPSSTTYDGGYYNTSVFDTSIDGGFYNTSSFNAIIDSGRIA